MLEKVKFILICLAILLGLYALYFVVGVQVLSYFWLQKDAPDTIPTEIASELQANLVASSLPFEPPAKKEELEKADRVWMSGKAPNITVDLERKAESFRAFLTLEKGTSETYLFLNSEILQVWKTSDRKQFKNLTPVETNFGEKHSCQIGSLFEDVSYLFQNSYLVTSRCYDKGLKFRMFVWDSKTLEFHKFDESKFDSNYLVLKVAEDSWLIAYGMKWLRMGPESYLANYTQIMLFSPKHPKGFSVAKIGLQDGNITNWYLRDKTLVMKTYGDMNSKSANFTWELDLSKIPN